MSNPIRNNTTVRSLFLFVFLLITSHRLLFSYFNSNSRESEISGKQEDEKIRLLMQIADASSEDSLKKVYSLQKALEISTEKNDIKSQLMILDRLGNYYSDISDNLTAKIYFLKIISLIKAQLGSNNKDEYFNRLLAETYLDMSLITFVLDGDYERTLDYCFNGLKIAEEFKFEDLIAYIKNRIGFVHRDLSNYSLAEQFFRESAELAKKTGNDTLMVTSLNEMSNVKIMGLVSKDQLNRNNFRDIIKMKEEVLRITESINYTRGMSFVRHDIGFAYSLMYDFGKSIEYLSQSVEVELKYSNYRGLAISYYNLGDCYMNIKDYKKALSYGIKALYISNRYNFKIEKGKNYKLMASIHERIGNLDSALHYLKLSIGIEDEIFNEEKTRQIANFQVNYETAAKDKEILLLRKEQDLKSLEISRRNDLIKYLSALTLLVLILGFVIIGRYKLKTKTAKLLEEKNMELNAANKKLEEINATKDKFFSIIAHDLRNPFNTFRNIFESFHRDYDEFSKAETFEMLGDIKDYAKNIDELLSNLLQWAKIQLGKTLANPDNVNLLQLVKNNIDLLKKNAELKNISIQTEINPDLYVFADANMILSVIRNLMTNALKFTHSGGNVRIGAVKSGAFIEVSVSDSGIGMNDEELSKLFRIDMYHSTPGTSNEKGTGLGLILCKEFIAKNNGTIKVESSIGKGSIFTFSLPKGNNEAGIEYST